MTRGARIALLIAVAAVAGAAGFLASRQFAPSAPAQVVAQETVDALFALQLPDTDGNEQTMAQWRGKVVVVNFWATWCPPCRKEIPDFSDASRALAGDPVQFVGLSIDDADKVRAFDKELDVPYPLLIASPQVLGLAAGFGNQAQALPFTVIFDRDGKVRHVKLGTLKRAELEGKIRALLAS
ncbi:TlpA family protein disulfide reductase [Thauera sinica]|uniref:TlpA family protein disulfide reductase n=1 Tax=Thauera sinica TaxID=2665146 RepID=A0ABW1AX96_9RHOO|nr:TlpA disulfide reductase family protein [Thauera sp. K11]ATE58872.1 thioredoxin [Thauera sp. K11]